MSIPIRNLYYLLCYAWDALEQREVVDATALAKHKMSDLFARVLTVATNDLIRRGLDRGYVAETQEIPGIRGRMDLSACVKTRAVTRARAVCTFDELVHDIA